jgi:hypothetical protein
VIPEISTGTDDCDESLFQVAPVEEHARTTLLMLELESLHSPPPPPLKGPRVDSCCSSRRGRGVGASTAAASASFFSFLIWSFSLFLSEKILAGTKNSPLWDFSALLSVAHNKMGEDNYHPFEIILGFLSVEIAKIAVT